MSTSTPVNRRILFARWPVGAPVPEDFKTISEPLPTANSRQVQLRTLYLSLDPYMRGRMAPGPSYVEPMALGDTMCGQTVLLDIGQPNETVVVTAATGAVGSVVGQIAKMKGCRAVGIAGGAEKCAYAVETLGYDACVDHHAEDFPALLAKACPTGIDIYFEGVGGTVLEAALPLLNLHSRVPLVGCVTYYNLKSLPTSVDHIPALLRQMVVNRIKVQGIIAFDHYETRYADFARDMGIWVRDGKIKYREEVLDGLERAPNGLMGMLRGDNFGKLIVKVADG